MSTRIANWIEEDSERRIFTGFSRKYISSERYIWICSLTLHSEDGVKTFVGTSQCPGNIPPKTKAQLCAESEVLNYLDAMDGIDNSNKSYLQRHSRSNKLFSDFAPVNESQHQHAENYMYPSESRYQGNYSHTAEFAPNNQTIHDLYAHETIPFAQPEHMHHSYTQTSASLPNQLHQYPDNFNTKSNELSLEHPQPRHEYGELYHEHNKVRAGDFSFHQSADNNNYPRNPNVHEAFVVHPSQHTDKSYYPHNPNVPDDNFQSHQSQEDNNSYYPPNPDVQFEHFKYPPQKAGDNNSYRNSFNAREIETGTDSHPTNDIVTPHAPHLQKSIPSNPELNGKYALRSYNVPEARYLPISDGEFSSPRELEGTLQRNFPHTAIF